jgi:acyl carrier protein
MTREEFLLQMDEILGLPSGTLRGDEKLEELENWDSTSLITFIALADSNAGVMVSPAQVVNCTTVADLLRVARVDTQSSRSQSAV